jgi:hypothetical protein
MFVSLGRAPPASVVTLSGRWCSRRSYSAFSSLPRAPARHTRGANLYYSTHAKQGTSKSPDTCENRGATSSLSTNLLIQAAKEYTGPLDVPTAFLSKYRLARKGDAAGVFLLDAEPSDQKTVLAHLRVDPSKEIPYDGTKAEQIQHFKVVTSLLGIRMYVAMALHPRRGEPGHTVLWLIDTGSPFTFISRSVSHGPY